MKQPGSLKADSLAELKQIVEKVPYCQIAQILLAVNLKATDSILYSDQLKLAVAYAGSRQKLKQLVESIDQKPLPGEPVAVNEQAQRAELDTTSSTTELDVKETTLPSSVEDKDTREQLVDQLDADVGAVKEDSMEVSMEEQSTLVSTPASEEEHADDASGDDFLVKLQQLIAQKLVEITKDDESLITQKLVEITKDDDSFSNNLTVATGEVENSGEHESEFEEPESEFKFTPSVYDIETHLAQQEGEGVVINNQEERTPVSRKELIDRFIKSEPKITPKKEFFNPVDKARQSSQDNDEIISETLAKIQLQQGNVEKALKIYEKLSLIYPEKRVYFAAQIAKVKESL
jgi:hypothetical protein